jgi:hypothetical protein
MSDTIGEQYPQPDARGWLVFHGLPDDLQRAEDSTQYADLGRAGRGDWWDPALWGVQTRAEAHQKVDEAIEVVGDAARPAWGRFTRPATPTERLLLQHLGYLLPTDDTGDPAPLYTVVGYVTDTLRCRTWPQLENQEVSP